MGGLSEIPSQGAWLGIILGPMRETPMKRLFRMQRIHLDQSTVQIQVA